MSEEITEAKFWRDRFYQVSIMNEKSMEIIKLLMDRANKKEWVGLTDAEGAEIWADAHDLEGNRLVVPKEIVKRIEAKLKEKNNA